MSKELLSNITGNEQIMDKLNQFVQEAMEILKNEPVKEPKERSMSDVGIDLIRDYRGVLDANINSLESMYLDFSEIASDLRDQIKSLTDGNKCKCKEPVTEHKTGKIENLDHKKLKKLKKQVKELDGLVDKILEVMESVTNYVAEHDEKLGRINKRLDVIEEKLGIEKSDKGSVMVSNTPWRELFDILFGDDDKKEEDGTPEIANDDTDDQRAPETTETKTEEAVKDDAVKEEVKKPTKKKSTSKKKATE